jgi:hypothetical protein
MAVVGEMGWGNDKNDGGGAYENDEMERNRDLKARPSVISCPFVFDQIHQFRS